MEFELVQDFDRYLAVVRSAAQWRMSNSIYSRYWDPDLLTPESLRKEFFDDQAWVLLRDREPVAALFVSEPSRRKSTGWESEIGPEFKSDACAYLDQIAVCQHLIGTGIVTELFREVENLARSRNFSAMRLDCDAAIPKLEQVYRRNGFEVVKQHDVGHRISVFMERTVPTLP